MTFESNRMLSRAVWSKLCAINLMCNSNDICSAAGPALLQHRAIYLSDLFTFLACSCSNDVALVIML